MLKNTENIALRSLQVLYVFVLREEEVTIFAANGNFFPSKYKCIYKTRKLRRAIFSVFYSIFLPNSANLLISRKSFWCGERFA